MGHQVADYYQKQAISTLEQQHQEKLNEMIAFYKKANQQHLIEQEVIKIPSMPSKHLAYVEGTLFEDYLHDMKITQQFASLNRKAIVETICSEMEWTVLESFSTIHNYVDLDAMILRKGAVSAKLGEVFIVPINMRDGSLICVGKGNQEWNESAPHGAGRVLSRKSAKDTLSMEVYKQSMKDVYTTSVNIDTLDEAPEAYKPMEVIAEHIKPTATILKRITPVYNFKAKE